ncbi:MAG: ABC transporter ATP-binding protein [SAR324 cluster bacterium]|nr:ABC transporter ATP-binding protein [SAR324 cluster bacterium]
MKEQSRLLLQVDSLKTILETEDGVITPVNDVSFSIKYGQALGVVGESGCGKSMTALSIMRLLPHPYGKITAGSIYWQDDNLLERSEDAMLKIRGKQIGMIFQEPMTALNPVFTIGNQICETIRFHQKNSKEESRKKALELLNLVSIPDAEMRMNDYPHQLSGGMRQRVMIAIALSCRPQLLIADEPTTALDVTIQAQILDLIQNLRDEIGMSLMLITHDLGVIAETCDEAIVMYAGKIVEKSSVALLFESPKHPYTEGLLKSIPLMEDKAKNTLHTIEGLVPSLHQVPQGCAFHDRCPDRMEQCRENPPSLIALPGERAVACFKYE